MEILRLGRCPGDVDEIAVETVVDEEDGIPAAETKPMTAWKWWIWFGKQGKEI